MSATTPTSFSLPWLCLVVLNGLDTVFTLLLVGQLGAVEANPAMAWLLSVSPLVFVWYKSVLVPPGALLLSVLGMRWTLAAINLVYVGVLVSHLLCLRQVWACPIWIAPVLQLPA